MQVNLFVRNATGPEPANRSIPAALLAAALAAVPASHLQAQTTNAPPPQSGRQHNGQN